ncbi:MAG: chemotaxis protein CheW [Deltaproteobacteria bacterium]|nr:chemotaxis protein CheW [Deltaproteobacteria bacterium]
MSGDLHYVRFEARGDLFALPLREVREVIEPSALTPIPHGPRSALGVMNHHGRVVTLIDLRSLLLGEQPASPAICLLLDAPDRRVALGVDRVEGIGPLHVEEGLARLGQRAVSVLNSARVFDAVDLSFDQGGMVESTSQTLEEL